MSYQYLPPNVRDLSLFDHPELAEDLVDLFIPSSDRREGCLLFVICDPDGRPDHPVLIEGTPPRPTYEDAVGVLRVLEVFEGLPYLLALGTPGRPGDAEFLDLLSGEADRSATGPRLGSYLAYASGAVHELPERLAA